MTTMKSSLFVVVTSGVLAGLATTALASVIVNRMSFEDALSGSDLVVLGKVVESPEIGVFDPEIGVRRQHTIWVKQYIKGEGPDEITVITAGGKFWKDTDEGRKLYEGSSDAAPQLPPEGTEVLLFLRSWGGGYLIYSATHGVVPVKTEPDGTRFVWLRFQSPEGMPPDTRGNYEAGLERGLKPGEKAYRGRIEVHELKAVAHRILSPQP